MGMERPAKKARKAKEAIEEEWPTEEWPAEEWEQEAGEEQTATAPARGKVAPSADALLEPVISDLEPGAVVLYWDGWRGVIRDAFLELNEFWVSEEDSGEIVRDDAGDIVHFKSEELELVARPPIAPPNPRQSEGAPGGVIVIGNERQMEKILNHFGTPDPKERNQPQMLLALPCTLCQADKILQLASEGVSDDVRKLGQELRNDIHVAVRAYHMKQAVQELGCDLLRMDGFYLMASITVPHSWEDIETAKGWRKKWQREICNQIDMQCTARALHEAEDGSPEDTARRSLGQDLGVTVSLALWDEEVQTNLRQRLDVDLPLKFTDANDGRITVMLLPSDALMHIEEGVLCFSENPDGDYLAEVAADEGEIGAGEPADEVAGRDEDHKPTAAAGPQGKTLAEWEKEQAQFAHLPKLPPDWVRVISQKTGEVYFFNKKTQAATFDLPDWPLPPGWAKHTSKTTGKSYYFHAAKRKSQFERPTQ